MNHAGIRSALSRIAWAYLLIHLHFRLNNLDLLPDWAGYLLIFSAIGLLAGELRDLPLLRPFCILLGAVSGVDWLSFLLTGAEFTGRFFLLSALITCVALYFHFQLLTDLAALAARPSFWRTAAVSLGRIFGGFALGAAAGTLLAVITSALSWADWLFRPMVKVIRAVPVASFIVLVLLWASTGRVPAIVSGLMVLPVLWGNVCKGISQTDGQLLEAARAYRFGRWKTLRLVYVPSVLPYFASGCATGLGLAWKAGVAAEVLCQPRLAIGTQVYRAKITLETPDLFAWTAVIVTVSVIFERLFLRLVDAAVRKAGS